MSIRHCFLALLLALLAAKVLSLPAAAVESTGHVQHVLLISVDGMHALDLANFVSAHPNSTLAQLSQHGTTFRNALSSQPSDSFPGLMAIITGGSPVSTGVWYDNSYDRALSPPVSFHAGNCPTTVGTNVLYDESIDIDNTKLNGGGGINPQALPRDPKRNCEPVYPHQFLKANTIFEVIHEAGMRTAWSDKHLAYDIVRGPSGKGVDDLFTPEIVAPVWSGGGDGTSSVPNAEAYDDVKVQAVLNWIDGLNHEGTKKVGVPAIFGMNFQEVSVGQKLAGNGYLDVLGSPSPGLSDALSHTDKSLGKMVDELKKQGLYDSTLIIITAKHGQSPIDVNKRVAVDDSPYTSLVPGIAQLTDDDVAIIWLTDQSQTSNAVSILSQPGNEALLGIQEIYAGNSLQLWSNSPLSGDTRAPDILIRTNYGVIYTGGSKIAEHGGLGDDDRHVALLVSIPGMQHSELRSPVETMQIAPTILHALGLNPNALKAVRVEKTTELPGLALQP